MSKNELQEEIARERQRRREWLAKGDHKRAEASWRRIRRMLLMQAGK